MFLTFTLLLTGCVQSDSISTATTKSANQREVAGLGQFVLTDDEMWDAKIDINGSDVEVSLHTYGSDFETIAKYAQSVIAHNAISRKKIEQDVESGLRSMEWKFREFKFDKEIDVTQFEIKSMLFGRQIDGTDLILDINLRYPNEKSRWLPSYSGIDHGSLNWIPASAFSD